MDFKIKFNADNAAFTVMPEEEASRILEKIAEDIRQGLVEGPVMDINGNKVGHWGFC